jgi:DNA-binding NarL/FixJ family response regulator
MTNKLRVLIAEDHKTVREGIKLLVNGQADMEVIGEAGDGEAAIALFEKLQPDLIVMDISMPTLNGLKATKRLKAKFPKSKILTLTRHTDDGYLRQLIAAGASGYVLKQSAPSELINAIRSVGNGNSVPRSEPDAESSRRIRKQDRIAPRREPRRPLESRSEVLKLIAFGYSNKEIATRLNLSVKTVEAHKANAMRKLGIASRIDIVKYAILQNWLQDD